MGRLTIDDRIQRDGDRWRYIWYLEQELELRKTRQAVIRSSLALNIILLIALAWVVFR